MQKLSSLPPKNRFAITASVVVVSLVMWLSPRISINLTPSLDKTVFWIAEPNKQAMRSGVYVMFETPTLFSQYTDAPYPRYMIKQIACMEGNKLEVKGDIYICDGKVVGKGKHVSLSGRPVKLFKFSGIIPLDKLFVVGHHKDSFDSRYFGFVDKNDVKAIVYPIF